MDDVIAVVPTIGEAPQLPALVDRLLQEGVAEVMLAVNRPGATLPPMPAGPVFRYDYDGPIYRGWNVAIAQATIEGATLAVLNDDIELDPGALGSAEVLMWSDERLAAVGLDYGMHGDGGPALAYVRGSYRHLGLPGWAFLLDCRKELPFVDEQFEWWFGDDDLFFQLEERWSLAVAVGCRVRHQGEATASRHPWTHEAKVRDAARFREKWGNR